MKIKSVTNMIFKPAFILAAFLVCMLLLAVPQQASSQTAPAPTAAGGTFEQRLAQRKAERNVVLDERTTKRLQAVCVQAQGKVRVLQQKTTPAMVNRQRVYAQMDAKLWVIIGKLKIAGKDTFKLEQQRATLAQKSNTFQTTAQLYQQNLDDILSVNCQADPVGFKALLDTARIYRGQLRDQSTDIRNYTNNEIKPALGGFASELSVKPNTDDQQ